VARFFKSLNATIKNPAFKGAEIKRLMNASRVTDWLTLAIATLIRKNTSVKPANPTGFFLNVFQPLSMYWLILTV
jgi:hypothetical protein